MALTVDIITPLKLSQVQTQRIDLLLDYVLHALRIGGYLKELDLQNQAGSLFASAAKHDERPYLRLSVYIKDRDHVLGQETNIPVFHANKEIP